MIRTIWLQLICWSLVAVITDDAATALPAWQGFESAGRQEKVVADSAIQSLLEAQAIDGRIPGVVAAIVEEGKPIRIAAHGVRKSDRKVKMRIDDPMHLGSCTKAMTGVLVGRLVDEGKLSFEDTIENRLPKLAEAIHKDYRQVTLRQCLTHTSGMPANASNWWLNANDDQMTINRKRFLIAVDSLSSKPEHLPGENYLYSNLGYMVAGLMIEKVTQQSWEEAISQRLFEPLAITNFGFGIPGKLKSTEAPWGHRFGDNDQLRPIQGDNAPALGPAGTVHMPIQQWSRFVLVANQGFRLAEDPQTKDCKEASRLLKPATWKEIFTVQEAGGKSTNYGCGWSIVARPWAGGKTTTHSGSNTMWYCVVWTAPARKKAFLVAVNIAGNETSNLVDQIVSQLIQLDRNSVNEESE